MYLIEQKGKKMKALMKTPHGIEYKEVLLNDSHDVLLKVSTVGLCRTDLLVAQGKIGTLENIILGHEFSAQVVRDKTGVLKEGQWVGVNPLYARSFMGLDFDGAICEYISVPFDKVIPTQSTDARLIAYLEPLAASMAVLKALPENQDVRLAVVGKNRIAMLTVIVLESMGYKVEVLDEKENFGEEVYDFIVETVFTQEVIHKMCVALKDSGTLIVKSRRQFPEGVTAALMVAKELTFRSVNYYDFHKAMRWLENNEKSVKPLLGDVYNVNSWQEAFDAAQSGEQKKIFIQI